jgi:hypothetical protein
VIWCKRRPGWSNSGAARLALIEQIFDLAHIEDNAPRAVGKGVAPEKLPLAIPAKGVVLKVDHPDLGNAHLCIVVQLPLKTATCLPATGPRKRLKGAE